MSNTFTFLFLLADLKKVYVNSIGEETYIANKFVKEARTFEKFK